MKTKLAILGSLVVLALSAFLNTPPSNLESNYYSTDEETTAGAKVEPVARSTSTFYEFMLEDMKQVDGYIVETYREYEVHEDAEGDVIIRIPTENYQYLRYQSE